MRSASIRVVSVCVCFVSFLVNRNLLRRAGPVSLSSRCPDADLEGFYSPANSAWMLTVCLFVSTLSFAKCVTLDGNSIYIMFIIFNI